MNMLQEIGKDLFASVMTVALMLALCVWFVVFCIRLMIDEQWRKNAKRD